jgi:prolyl-tRNA editing enzyme YbaK/EbsC (Cys-tRNA(Pro) deacylase)
MSGLDRFREAAAALGLDPEVREFPESTHTAAEAAAAIGCDVAAIVKSLVFTADGAPLLVLASGPNRVDTAALGARLGVTIGKADAALVKEATGYSIGGVPPLGFSAPLRTLMDESLLALPEVWAAAGTSTSVFPIAPDDLARLTRAEIVAVA